MCALRHRATNPFALRCLTGIHAVFLVALVGCGWPLWSLLLLIWPAFGCAGASSQPDSDHLRLYACGTVLIAAGHVVSVCARTPWQAPPALTLTTAAVELPLAVLAVAVARAAGTTASAPAATPAPAVASMELAEAI